MIKLKNSLMYILCLALVIMSCAALITAFYIDRNKSASNKNEPENYSVSEKHAQTQSSINADNYNHTTTKHGLSQETQKTDAPVTAGHLYKVVLCEDNITVFALNQTEPYIKIFIDSKNIPSEDRKLLENGIYADTKAQLIRILEDYDS